MPPPWHSGAGTLILLVVYILATIGMVRLVFFSRQPAADGLAAVKGG